MGAVLLVVVVYLAAVVQTSLVDMLRIGHVTPDLLALTAVVWVLLAPGRSGFLVAGAIVLVGDLIAPGHLGTGAAAMLVVGYGLWRLQARAKLANLGAQLLAVWAAVTVWAIAVGCSGWLLGDVSLSLSTVAARAAGVGLYTAGVALPVLMVVGWIREPWIARARKMEY